MHLVYIHVHVHMYMYILYSIFSITPVWILILLSVLKKEQTKYQESRSCSTHGTYSDPFHR